MSLSSILTSLENQVSTTLGAEWKELNYIYDLEQNSFRAGKKAYGVGADSGNSVSGTTKAVTIDFNLFVVLTRTYINRSNDVKEREVLSDIYDQFDAINVNVFQKKLNNANVLLVQDISYSSPEKVDEQTISVRVDFTIKYRQQT